MKNFNEQLEIAIKQHADGNFAEARDIYLKLYEIDSSNIKLNFWIGNLFFQLELYNDAIVFFKRVIELNSNYKEAINNLGLCYHSIKNYNSAADTFKLAIKQFPDYYIPYFNLLISLSQSEGFEEIENQIKNINSEIRSKLIEDFSYYLVEHDQFISAEKFAKILLNLGKTRQAIFLSGMKENKEGKFELALKKLLSIKEETLDDIGLIVQLAHSYYGIKQYEESIQYYKKAIMLHRNNPQIYFNLANSFKELKQYSSAEENYNFAVNLNPNFETAYINLIEVLLKQFKRESALTIAQKCIQKFPQSKDLMINCGVVLLENEMFSEAETFYLKLLERFPDAEEIRFDLGVLYLLLGNFTKGWLEYENRNLERLHTNNPYTPIYQGECLSNKKLLVLDEQGLGDIVQFARFFKLVHERGGEVIFKVRDNIKDFMSSQSYISEVLSLNDSKPVTCDYKISLMSLAKYFKIEEIKKTSAENYIEISDFEQEISGFRKTENLKIGISWKGNPKHKYDYKRSLDLSAFEFLSKIKDLDVYCLQVGNISTEEENLLKRYGFINIEEEIKPFNKFFGLVDKLDVIISVDTLTTHIAGSLNKKTFLLLSKVADWRWLTKGEKTIWYDSVEIIRQKSYGNWDEVFLKLKTKLSNLINTKMATYRLASDKEYHNLKLIAFDFHLKNELNQAIEIYNQIVCNFPDDLEIRFWLGKALYEKNRIDEAIEHFEIIKQLNPDYNVEYRIFMARIYFEAKQYNDGIKILSKGKYEEFIFDRFYLIGHCYENLNELEKAEENYLKAIDLDNSFTQIILRLAEVTMKQKKFNESEQYFEKYISVSQDNIKVLNNYGFTKIKNCKFDEAIEIFNKAHQLNKNNNKVIYNLGTAYYYNNNFIESIRSYEKIISRNPYHSFAIKGKSFSLLAESKFSEGWQEFASACQYPPEISKEGKVSELKEVTSNKVIYVFSEQGFGDIIQFSRYIKLLRKNNKIILELPHPLLSLFKKNDVADLYVENSDVNYLNYEYDNFINLLKIPSLLDKSEIFCRALSLTEFDKNDEISRLMSSIKEIKIGLIWSGNPEYSWNSFRTFPIEEMNRIIQKNNNQFIGIQVGSHKKQGVKLFSQNSNFTDLSENIKNFEDTAHIISNLDLIISVDTSVVHLAGSMNKRTVLLLSTAPDWRWKAPDKTNWYESIEIIRQSKNGIWTDVVEKIQNILGAMHEFEMMDNNNQMNENHTFVKSDNPQNGVIKEKIELMQGEKILEEYFQKAYSFQLEGNLEEAIVNYQKVLEINPFNENAYNNLGLIFREKRLFDEALSIFNILNEINPNNPITLNNVGIIYEILGEFKTALEYFNKAKEYYRNYAEAYINAANCYETLGEFNNAIQNINRAIELNPEDFDIRFNRSLMYLKEKQFDIGFVEYESRLKRKIYPQRKFLKERLSSNIVKNKRILLYDEQGYGDTLNFVRYCKLLKENSNYIILECHKNLVALIENCPYIDEVISRNGSEEPTDKYDFHIPLLSLPLLFKTSFNSIPNETPYLFAKKNKIVEWKKRIGNTDKLKIGLMWEGKMPLNNLQRACKLENFYKLYGNKKYEIISLQIGDVEERDREKMVKYGISNYSKFIKNFDDTAALISNLDMVVTIDTSIAHLAGGLGINVAVILSYKADWRWFRDLNESPWYPTMKLYRQKKFGDWSHPIKNLVEILEKL